MILTAGRFEATDKWTNVEFPAIDASGTPVVIASIATFHGHNTAGIRMRNVQADSIEAFIEEETSANPETSHVREAIRFIGAPTGPIRDASGSTIGEAGVVELEQPDRDRWHTISLTETYDNPVVFTQILTYRGGQACHGRMRNVQPDSFEFQIEEWSTYNGSHVKEEIGYIVLEQGTHELANGAPLDVRKVSANHTWTPVEFGAEFGGEQAVVSQCQTRNGGHEVVTRHRNLHAQGIDIRLQEEEARDGQHVQETIGVLATPRRDTDIGLGRVEEVTHLWKAFKFESRMDASPVVLASIETFNGKNPAAPRLRNLSPSGAEVFVEEEASEDREMKHNKETISVIVVPNGRLWNKAGNLIGEAGTLRTDQPGRDRWHSLKFDERYSDPVVFMQIMTYNGEHPSHIRLRNINSDSCEFQIEEWNYLNGKHFEEAIGYFIVEKGVHELSDGAQLHVGTTQSNHEWGSEVGFVPDYKNKQPVVITQCQTRNGTHEVVTRTRNLDAHGFEVRVQEEQARDGEHTIETIGFLGAARPGRMVPEYQASDVPEVKVSGFDPETCGFHFRNRGFSGGYTLPNPISIGPIEIDEIGDTTNGMCGGMVFAARDYYEYGRSPWPEDLLDKQPPNSPVSRDVPTEDSKLFDFLSERLFDSFKPGSGNALGAALYQTLMNSANTKKWGQVKKSRNEVMKEQWENTIKPTLDNDNPCPLGLIHVDTHGKPFKTGLNKLGDNHQVLAYGYTQSGNVIEIYVYDPNHPYWSGNSEVRIQFEMKNDLSNWFEPTYIGSSKPLYAFFAPSYSPKEPPTF